VDWMKEIYDAASSRIKSPILGSVAVAFVLFNWKPLYFLFFSGQQALEKFDYFEAHTNHSSLYYYPISVGIGLALVAPFISYFGSWCASRPLLWKRLLEDTNAHRVLEQKNQLALERKNAEALFEQTLIDRAKRDEEVKQIDDLETRKVLKKRIESVRSSLLGYEGDERKSDRKFVLSKLAWDILIWAEQSGDKILVDRANAGITVDPPFGRGERDHVLVTHGPACFTGCFFTATEVCPTNRTHSPHPPRR